MEDTLGNLLPDPARGFTGALIPQEVADRELAGRMMAAQMAQGAMEGGGGGLADLPVEAQAPRQEPERYDGGPCPWCGSEEWTSKEQEYEQVMLPIRPRAASPWRGNTGPGRPGPASDENQPLVPFYRPDLYPIILQRSVSVYGQLLGKQRRGPDPGPAEHVNRRSRRSSTAW